MAKYEIKELGLRFQIMPQNRVIAARKMVVTNRGGYIVQGSKGQYYITRGSTRHARRWDYTPIEPGSYGRDLAFAIYQLDGITSEQFNDYAAICDAKTKSRKIRNAADEIEAALDTLGVKIPASLQKRIGKAVEAAGK